MTTDTDTNPAHGHGGHGSEGVDGQRRDFLTLAAASLTTAGVALAAWPLIDSMEPAKDTLARGAPIDVDLSKIKPGQQILVTWRSKPIFILRRTKKMLELLQSKAMRARLRDPNSENFQQPKYADNWHRSINPEYAVLVGICTHLGCIPELKPTPGAMGPNWPGGYFCPCHGSKYDFAGRVFQGVPAPLNLPVPPYHFVDKHTVRIGENPKGSKFVLLDVEQL